MVKRNLPRELLIYSATQKSSVDVYMKNGFCMHGTMLYIGADYIVFKEDDSKPAKGIQLLRQDAISTIKLPNPPEGVENIHGSIPEGFNPLGLK